jgi:hypothetical protein
MLRVLSEFCKIVTLAFSFLMMVDSTERLKTMPWKTCELARPLPTILHTRTLSTLKVVFSGIIDMQAWTKKNPN